MDSGIIGNLKKVMSGEYYWVTHFEQENKKKHSSSQNQHVESAFRRSRRFCEMAVKARLMKRIFEDCDNIILINIEVMCYTYTLN